MGTAVPGPHLTHSDCTGQTQRDKSAKKGELLSSKASIFPGKWELSSQTFLTWMEMNSISLPFQGGIHPPIEREGHDKLFSILSYCIEIERALARSRDSPSRWALWSLFSLFSHYRSNESADPKCPTAVMNPSDTAGSKLRGKSQCDDIKMKHDHIAIKSHTPSQ